MARAALLPYVVLQSALINLGIFFDKLSSMNTSPAVVGVVIALCDAVRWPGLLVQFVRAFHCLLTAVAAHIRIVSECVGVVEHQTTQGTGGTSTQPRGRCVETGSFSSALRSLQQVREAACVA
jgi:hypothetical protein